MRPPTSTSASSDFEVVVVNINRFLVHKETLLDFLASAELPEEDEHK